MLARSTAWLATALVLALTVLAASPELHERLHGHGPAPATAAHHDGIPSDGSQSHEGDDGCIVTLFAQGVVLALSLLALVFIGRALPAACFAVFDGIIPDAPRYLHLPPQAPPLA